MAPSHLQEVHVLQSFLMIVLLELIIAYTYNMIIIKSSTIGLYLHAVHTLNFCSSPEDTNSVMRCYQVCFLPVAWLKDFCT